MIDVALTIPETLKITHGLESTGELGKKKKKHANITLPLDVPTGTTLLVFLKPPSPSQDGLSVYIG